MKILPFKIPKPANNALIYQEDEELKFFDQFHQHEEIQLSYIVEGEGTIIVGDTINYYNKGTILAIGSNLPHVLKSDTTIVKTSKMITLFFSKNAFGVSFFELEELKELSSFFKKVDFGFKVSTKSKKLETLFLKLKNSGKLHRFIILLDILKILSNTKYQHLSSFIYEKKYSDSEGKRMRDVMDFTMQNFEREINLKSVARISAMTKNAFCKYFKKRTNKTYFTFLNEVRVENACKLILSKQEYTIAEIAEKSGFNNISNFNRQFKSIKKKSPSKYRKTVAN